MLTAKNILVPTDFSETAQPAIDCALQLARQSKATVHFLHVIDFSLFGPPYVPQAGFIYEIPPTEVEARLDALQTLHADVHVVTAHTMGNPPDEIVKYAESEGIDLICMCSHGYRGLKRRLFGSTTEAVVRRASCPVLTMHIASGKADQPAPSEPRTIEAEH